MSDGAKPCVHLLEQTHHLGLHPDIGLHRDAADRMMGQDLGHQRLGTALVMAIVEAQMIALPARWRAVAAPMPLLPPVISTRLFMDPPGRVAHGGTARWMAAESGRAVIHHGLHQHLVEALIALLIERDRIAQHPQRMALIIRLIGRVHMVMLDQAKTQ